MTDKKLADITVVKMNMQTQLSSNIKCEKKQMVLFAQISQERFLNRNKDFFLDIK